MALLGLLIIPILVAGAFFLICKETITWKEFLVQVGASVLVVTLGYFITKWGALRDTEHLNGRITGKPSGTEHCCHCHTVCDHRDKNGNCTASHEQCAHSSDHWWGLETTVGSIRVKGCSGWNHPPQEWTNAVIGEPATVEHGYTNYLKADPDSLMVHSALSKYGPQVPRFPEVYNFYRVNPVIGAGVPVPEGWQEAMREINADLGAKNQVDVTVMLTGNSDPTFAQAVESKWLYGPKNSITIVIGADGDKAGWVRVVTFSKVEALRVRLRDDITSKSLTGPEIPNTIRSLVGAMFKRTPMADYEYLARSATPTIGWLVFLYILGTALSVGLGVFMHKEDIFGDESRWANNKKGFGKPYRRWQ